MTGAAETVAPVDIETHQYLTFRLDGEVFAIGILAVKEIIQYGGLTAVPMMPEFIRGVINLRGAVVPVVDPVVRFGKPPQQAGRHTCIVIAEVAYEDEMHEIGLVVDAVNEVLEIPPGQVEPPPKFGSRIRVDFIAGMGKAGSGFVVILDVSRLLSLEEMAALGEMRSSAPNPETCAADAS